MVSSTASKNDVSAACPAVRTSPSGRPFPSVARWILQVSPPRDLPIAWSAGSAVPNLLYVGGPPCGPGQGRAVLVDPGDRGVHAHRPVQIPGPGHRGAHRVTR